MMKAFALVLALVAGASLAAAHGTGKEKAHHGGQVVVAGHDHLELVAKDGELTLYVRGEDDKPEPVAGAVASATVLAGGKPVTVKLEPRGDNVLKGSGAFTVSKGTRVVVSLTMPEHKPVTARFILVD